MYSICCVHPSVRERVPLCVNNCVYVQVRVEHRFFRAFSQTPLSLHEWMCLSRSQGLRVCVCDRKCLSETEQAKERGRVGDERWQRESEETERCCGSSSVSGLLSGPWAAQLPQSAAALAVPWAQNPLHAAQAHLFQLAADPASSPAVQKWLK